MQLIKLALAGAIKRKEMKNTLILILCILFSPYLCAQAQNTSIDTTRLIRLNPILGINVDLPKIAFSDWESLGLVDKIDNIEIEYKVGFSIGISYTIKISDNVIFSPQTIISHRKMRLNFKKADRRFYSRIYTSTLVEVPIHLEFFSKKEKKINPSFIVGGRYMYDIANSYILKSNAAVDIGVGLETHIGKLNFKPQILYSSGLFDLKKGNISINDAGIKSIKRNTLSFRVIVNRSR